jgi:phosphate starvation-inducible protein PhoH and related proteins
MGARDRMIKLEIDGIEVEVPRKRTRKTRNGGVKPEVKEKFAEEHKAKPIIAKNENQKKYLHSLQFDTVSVGKGSAGSGKTWCAAAVAANKYLKGEIKQIIVARAYVPMGKSTGFWPGSVEEKLAPYVAPILNVIRERIGDHRYQAEFSKTIKIQPLEAIRGMSFPSGTFLILDESQNLSVEEVRSIVTRLEEGSQVAFCGDDKQRDVKGVSGIVYLANLIKKHNLPNCSVVEFTPADIVRSGLTRAFVEIFEKEGSAENIKEI